jgi:hypothetical protein
MRRAGFQIPEKDGSALFRGIHLTATPAVPSCLLGGVRESRDPRSPSFLGQVSMRTIDPFDSFAGCSQLLQTKESVSMSISVSQDALFAGRDATGVVPRPCHQQDPKRATGDRLFRVQAACGCNAITPAAADLILFCSGPSRLETTQRESQLHRGLHLQNSCLGTANKTFCHGDHGLDQAFLLPLPAASIPG